MIELELQILVYHLIILRQLNILYYLWRLPLVEMVWLGLYALIVKGLILLPLHAASLVFILGVIKALLVRLYLQMSILRYLVNALLVLSELVKVFGFVTFPDVGSLKDALVVVLDVIRLGSLGNQVSFV